MLPHIPLKFQLFLLGMLVSIPEVLLLGAEDDLNWFNVFLLVTSTGAGISVFGTWLVRSYYRKEIEKLDPYLERLATADFEVRMPSPGFVPLAPVSRSINRLTDALRQKINTRSSEKNEAEAVLACMTEGVIAVDADENLLNINRAALAMLGVKPLDPRGKSVQEVVRNSALIKYIRKTIGSQYPFEDPISINLHAASVGETLLSERNMQVHGAVLKDSAGASIGAVIVLSDVTKIHRLETMRQDFVANVSHELRTPITAIKGFVETLLDGAIDSPVEAKKFLLIVERQVERLGAIIEDMLNLSRLEQSRLRKEIDRKIVVVESIVGAAIELCTPKAKSKNIELAYACTPDIMGSISPALVEQALVNLINNAIEYSTSGKSVFVEVVSEGQDLFISVRDSGCGIDSKLIPRIFERFYRVDKARSRSNGGTGLGLSIVKHIMLIHSGEVRVESIVNRGSTFSLYFPASAVQTNNYSHAQSLGIA